MRLPFYIYPVGWQRNVWTPASQEQNLVISQRRFEKGVWGDKKKKSHVAISFDVIQYHRQLAESVMGGPSLFASRRCDVSTPWLQWSKQQPISKQHLALCGGDFSSLSSPHQHDTVFTNIWNILHLPCHSADWRGRSVLPSVRVCVCAACSSWEHGDDETPHNQSLQVDKHPAKWTASHFWESWLMGGGVEKKVTEESGVFLCLMARRGKCSHISGFALKNILIARRLFNIAMLRLESEHKENPSHSSL